MREVADRDGIDLAASHAYSDSESDLPMLRAVGNAVVVNPDAALRRIAIEEGWEIIALDRLGRRLKMLALLGAGTRVRLCGPGADRTGRRASSPCAGPARDRGAAARVSRRPALAVRPVSAGPRPRGAGLLAGSSASCRARRSRPAGNGGSNPLGARGRTPARPYPAVPRAVPERCEGLECVPARRGRARRGRCRPAPCRRHGASSA